MPSLQQMNLNDCSSPDVGRTLTGSDILHKHSINSLLEQQDFINRGVTSTTSDVLKESTMSISDLLGLSNPRGSLLNTQTNTNLATSSPFTPLTTNSTQNSMSPGLYMPSAKPIDWYQFDSIGQNSSTPLRKLQRNVSFDCPPPVSPSTPSSLYQRSFRDSPQFGSECSSPGTTDPPLLFGCVSSRSNSPDSDNSALSNVDNNLAELMNYFTINPNQQQQQYHQQQQLHLNALANVEFEIAKLKNVKALNALNLLQQQQQPQQNQILGLTHLLQHYSPNQLKNWQIQQTQATSSDANLDRAARYHRSSAALSDATCTWRGILPPRSYKTINYSPKVFLGGIPWDISEQSLIAAFKQFGPIVVEWPGQEHQVAPQPKGYVYIAFENEKQVRSLLAACTMLEGKFPNSINYFFKISSKRIKAKEVEVIPWIIGDSNYVKSTSQKLDPTKTVFVGALHGKLAAEGLAIVMNDLFDGVVYAGIDTDKYKYPIGSGRVTFNNYRSYMKAVSAAFIDIKASDFSKKVQVDPYLEDSLCSSCGVQHGPYYCRELTCFRYFCRSCWKWQHGSDPFYRNHKPLTRDSKSKIIIGVGPQQEQQQTTQQTTQQQPQQAQRQQPQPQQQPQQQQPPQQQQQFSTNIYQY